MGSAAGRGEDTHGDAVAKPPKSGIARKATEAVGARGLARFGDAETCARSPLSAAGELSEHCPKGREGNQKTWGFDTRASDAPRRVSGFCGWGSARLARSWRGGEYRARGRRACQDWAWRATASLRSPRGGQRSPRGFFFVTCFWTATAATASLAGASSVDFVSPKRS